VPRLRYDRLLEDAREVLRTLVFKESRFRGRGTPGTSLRILLPDHENVIDGRLV